MAAINFNVAFTDTGDNGSGPYTMVVRQDPTTAASGGTVLLTDTNATHPKQNVRSLSEKAVQYILNKLTVTAQSGVDALN